MKISTSRNCSRTEHPASANVLHVIAPIGARIEATVAAFATAAAWVLGAAVSCSGAWAAPAADSGAVAAKTPPAALAVYPKDLTALKSWELGQLVLMLMPDGPSPPGWDHRVDSGIRWKTDGYQLRQVGTDDEYWRYGLARVNVQGTTATVLKARTMELGWTVEYLTTSAPKHGPEDIQLKPGLPGAICFGSLYNNCWFDEPLKSLASAGLRIVKLCNKTRGDDTISAFQIFHTGKQPTVLLWSASGGSGGTYAWMTLKLKTEPSSRLCESPATSDPVAVNTSPTNRSRPVATPAIAPNQDIQFNQQTADEAATFRSLDRRTEICMRDGALAMLRNRSRDRDQIIDFQVRTCGGPMLQFFNGTSRRIVTQEQAVAFLIAAANTQLDRVLASGK